MRDKGGLQGLQALVCAHRSKAFVSSSARKSSTVSGGRRVPRHSVTTSSRKGGSGGSDSPSGACGGVNMEQSSTMAEFLLSLVA